MCTLGERLRKLKQNTTLCNVYPILTDSIRQISEIHRTWCERCYQSNSLLLRIISFIIVAPIVIVPVIAKLLQYARFNINTFDTGIYHNIVCNINSGLGFYSSVLHMNHLGEHFSPIILFFSPLYLVYPTPLWLLGFQGLAIGVTYFLIYRLSLLILGTNENDASWLFPFFVIFIASCYKPLTSALMFEFHPSTLATPILCGAILAMHKGHRAMLWFLTFLLLLAKENAILAVVGLSIYASLTSQSMASRACSPPRSLVVRPCCLFDCNACLSRAWMEPL